MFELFFGRITSYSDTFQPETEKSENGRHSRFYDEGKRENAFP